jgi:predicted nucleic-acid-binding protein
MRFVDANVILRYLLDDDPQLAEKATKIIEQGQVYVPFEVMAEVVYVMQGVYKVSRQEISSVLIQFIKLPNVTTNSEPVLNEALRIYAEKGVDFVDSLLCGYSIAEGAQVETFDRKLKKIISEQGTKRS